MLPQLTPDEAAVYDLIVNCNGRITQLEISKLAPQLGSHAKHEGYMSQESTLRRIRQIVRTLIMEHGLFVGADNKGYYIVKTETEKREYMERFERQARSSAKSYMQRYHVMAKNLGVRSAYFDKQMELEFENK